MPADPKSAALSHLARTIIETRGWISDEDAAAFLSAGFEEAKLLEVIAVVAASTITKHAASVTRPTIEPPFDNAGELLRQWRAQRGKPQLDLAFDTGISQMHISLVETGRSTPSQQMVADLSEALRIPLR